jgi:hypothetical protein
MKLVPQGAAERRRAELTCYALLAFMGPAASFILGFSNKVFQPTPGFLILGVSGTCTLVLFALFVSYIRVDQILGLTALALGVLAIGCWVLLVLPLLSRAREKPVIYLYPETTTQVRVTLDYNGQFTVTDPPYGDAGWLVEARPDGALTDVATGRAYPYLFWEGRDRDRYGFEQGFVVSGAEAGGFLREKLAVMGLAEREIDDFVAYWEPRLASNPYNLVSFPNEAYAKNVGLNVTPAPDTVIRVFMVLRAIDAPVDIAPQVFVKPARVGFTVVEWGGSEV